MEKNFRENLYSITYDGNLYNAKDIKKELIALDYQFETTTDTEILLTSYIHWGKDCVSKFNGVFSFVIYNKNAKEVFLARDHFGVKPLYYTFVNETLYFASEVKNILKDSEVKAKLDPNGICELIGLGPAHTPGNGVFKDMYELKPAEFIVFNEAGIHKEKYWTLESKPHTDNLETTCKTVLELLESSMRSQVESDTGVCTFLSGGLDSSIITTFANNYYKNNNLGKLNTFSVDYVDNAKNFVKSDFQPNSDEYYINIMTKKLGSKHTNIVIDTPELADTLEASMIARDFPGMADVDSSLLLFCKNVKPYSNIAISGECADEIFGGYPWFFRGDCLNSGTFPWSLALNEREKILNPDLLEKINLKSYIDSKYEESLNEVVTLESDSADTAKIRKINHLTFNWFMQTLLDRSDRMANYCDFEVRVPFCDYKLIEYVWNIPWEMKSLNGREKGLLRHIMKDYLPDEIVNRKKSPYPKTHNPNYLAKVKDILSDIVSNPNSPICSVLNRKYILEIMGSDGENFSRPWFGQLMTGPQLMAYLIQVNMWFEKYNPEISI